MKKNVILNIIVFIMLGEFVLSISKVIVSVFKSWFEDILANKLNRKIICIIGFQVLFGSLFLIFDYWMSFFQHGNFITASLLNNLVNIFGWEYIAIPAQNVLLTLFNIILVAFILYLFFPKMINKVKYPRLNFEYDSSSKEIIVSGTEMPRFRISFNYIRQSILFGVCLDVSIQLWIFNNFIYLNELPRIFLVSAILCTLLTFFYGIIFCNELKEYTYLSAIQIIFEVPQNHELIKVFEAIIKNGSLKIRGEEFFKELRDYIDNGVLIIFPKVSLNELNLDTLYQLEMSNFVQKEFKKEYKLRLGSIKKI